MMRSSFKLLVFSLAPCCAGSLHAQVSAALSGAVADASGGVVAAAAVAAKSRDTGMVRGTVTDAAGRYRIPSLPVGEYELRAGKPGFSDAVRTGVHLVVGEDAKVDFSLRVGEHRQQVTVNADAGLVDVTTRDISGLEDERQVRDLPLNGRSYDELLTLNPGVGNVTSAKTGGGGVSRSAAGNAVPVSGNRPQQKLFLLSGIEFTGAAENNMQPGGASGMLLGVDAVREFNVQRDSYSAEYGKRPGGQVIIVTQSGSNQWHGAVFEFLRNNALDAPNFFDQGFAPPFQRNQFGASMGGPIQHDKTFLFANYEGFRQNLHQTSAAFVPDLQSRADAVASLKPYLNLWPTPSASDLDFKSGASPDGIAEIFSSPLQTIREDFGTIRVDH